MWGGFDSKIADDSSSVSAEHGTGHCHPAHRNANLGKKRRLVDFRSADGCEVDDPTVLGLGKAPAPDARTFRSSPAGDGEEWDNPAVHRAVYERQLSQIPVTWRRFRVFRFLPFM